MMPKLKKMLSDNPLDADKEDKDYLETPCFLKKYKGWRWNQVLDEDPDYVRWLLTESDVKLGDKLRDQLMWALEERQ